jgi:hypothetical protein
MPFLVALLPRLLKDLGYQLTQSDFASVSRRFCVGFGLFFLWLLSFVVPVPISGSVLFIEVL